MAIDPLLRENARMSKIISCILVFLPLLDIYEIPILPISISEIILIFLVLYSLFLRNIILSNYAYIFFLIYAFTTSLIIANLNNYFYIDEWIFKWGRIILYSYCFLSLAPQYLNLNIFVITIKRLSVFFAIIQILQSFLWYILDIPLYFIVPGIKLHYVISDYNEYIQHLMEWGGATWRPSNFFLEPALFSFYAVVALISFLFLQKIKRT
ncbi:hypothetical protein [Veillonella criceti]|uniref:Uncharacterized protein n=1 Tax=Veillonella criceti TaxID=103891 RepID=A0A380NMG9_9FIRM|nr:hypothetical protein [Veillonella criceti]SUP44758.1 Uncharacterised protein [Veillonella criceti]